MSQDRNPSNPLYRYEDILRAIGHYIDTHKMQDVVVLQSDQGILLRGYRMLDDRGQHDPELVQHLFTPDQLAAIDEEARKRRGQQRTSRLFQ